MTPPEPLFGLTSAGALLRAAKRPLVITGAGLSADSGLPTYRGVGGLYEGKQTEEGLPIEVVLSGPMFKQDPALCWRYIHEIETACRGKTFNAGHRALAQLEARYESMWILTQNVDGFHRRAGSTKVIDIHGDISKLYCTRCQYKKVVENYESLAPLPKCPDCEGVVRPDVVLFEEELDSRKLVDLTNAMERADLVMTIGTSALFPYITAPVLEAKNGGKPTIEINPARTQLSSIVSVKLPMRAAEALDALTQEVLRTS